jgi:hypothetical protein
METSDSEDGFLNLPLDLVVALRDAAAGVGDRHGAERQRRRGVFRRSQIGHRSRAVSGLKKGEGGVPVAEGRSCSKRFEPSCRA